MPLARGGSRTALASKACDAETRVESELTQDLIRRFGHRRALQRQFPGVSLGCGRRMKYARDAGISKSKSVAVLRRSIFATASLIVGELKLRQPALHGFRKFISHTTE